MHDKSLAKIVRTRWVVSLIALLTVLIVACGSAAEPTAQPTTQQEPTATLAPQQIPAATATPAMAAPTSTPNPTAVPQEPSNARDTAVLVTEAEPASVGSWSEGCSAEIHSMGCQELTQDFLTWLDDRTSEIVPLSGIDSWEQKDTDKWIFHLRDGVKFHDGAPWNAAAAKYGIEYNAHPEYPSAAVTWTGPDVTGTVIDDLTLQVNCPHACPIFPRTALFTDFQDPEWFENANEGERSSMTMGFGPYRIVDYQPGVHTKFEAYEDYLPNENFYSQAPSIPNITHVYRPEPTVRAAMVNQGEADWAADIGFEQLDQVPKYSTGKTAEVYTLVLDTMWDPELKKQQVREALAHAINCQEMLDSFFDGRIPCHQAISMKGTVGITDENSKPYTYDPELAKQMLSEAGYDDANEIVINSRPGSNIHGLEILEAIITYWRDVGVNANLHSWGDLGKAREIQNSGCGNFSSDPDFATKMDCAQREPPGPCFCPSGAYEVATSNEILDMQRFNQSRMSCFNRTSRVCYSDLQKQMDAANAIPEGPERTQAMIEIANYAHEQVYFIPFFEVVYVYGLSPDLEYQPYYAPRVRANVMKFSQ